MIPCQCGCGGETNIYRGKPRKYIKNHSKRGVSFSEIHKERMSRSMKGRHVSPNTEFKVGHKTGMTNKQHSNTTKIKQSKTKIRSLNPMWKGGLTPLQKRIRNSNEYDSWRVSVFKRDNFICQECGQIGGELNAHHIKTLHQIIKENNILDIEDATNCIELWDLNNGQTLCIDCHDKYRV